jgi:hypothetical protein
MKRFTAELNGGTRSRRIIATDGKGRWAQMKMQEKNLS